MSHPVRVRGLKRPDDVMVQGDRVAPRAGAWIETIINPNLRDRAFVAPRAGAWIETVFAQLQHLIRAGSHPVRVRGLKRRIAPYFVWRLASHPVRVRGLKPC